VRLLMVRMSIESSLGSTRKCGNGGFPHEIEERNFAVGGVTVSKLIAVLCVGLALCFVVGTVCGAEKGDKAKTMTVKGKVTAVSAPDAKPLTITVTAEEKDLTFALADDVKIASGKDTAKTFADLKAGEMVTVMYTKAADGTLLASHIRIMKHEAK
jgi:hypothetical protein